MRPPLPSPRTQLKQSQLTHFPPGTFPSFAGNNLQHLSNNLGKARLHNLRKFLPAILLLLLAAIPLLSQQSPPITLSVSAVNLVASVRDQHGNLVRNLSKDDFTLDQDGKPQSITYFAKESDLPLTLGLLVDTSLSQRRLLDQERFASRSFLDHVLREDKDKAFLIHFDHEVELLQDLTASREKLLAAIDQLHTPQFSQSSSGGGSTSGGGDGKRRGSPRSRHGGRSLLLSSLYPASDQVIKKQHGPRAPLNLTDRVAPADKGFHPEATVGYHQLHLAVKQKATQVQTRNGFYLEH